MTEFMKERLRCYFCRCDVFNQNILLALSGSCSGLILIFAKGNEMVLIG